MKFTFLFKALLCSAKTPQCMSDCCQRYAKQICHCCCRNRIGYIVRTYNPQCNMRNHIVFMHQIITSAAIFIPCNICSTVIISFSCGCNSKRRNFCFHSCNQTGKPLNIALYYKISALVKLFHKQSKRISDIIKITEEVQMLRFYIKYNLMARMKLKKTICIFTWFHNKIIRMPCAWIAVNRFKNRTDGDCRVHSRLNQNHRKHGRSCCLAMCSGNTDRFLILKHQLSKEFRPV